MDCQLLRVLPYNYPKHFLRGFVVFVVISGLANLIEAGHIRSYFAFYYVFLDKLFVSVSNLYILNGILIFSLFPFKFLKGNTCTNVIFFILLVVILLLQLLSGLSGTVLRLETGRMLQHSMEMSIEDYDNENCTETTVLWDYIQREKQCCGICNYTNWYYVTQSNELPLSCCRIPAGAIGNFSCNPENVFPEGCLYKFGMSVQNYTFSIECFGYILTLTQLATILWSWYLAKRHPRAIYESH